MKTHADTTLDSKGRAITSNPAEKQQSDQVNNQFVDARSETIAQRKLQSMVNDYSAQQMQPVQRKANSTGFPDGLKAGIESDAASMGDTALQRASITVGPNNVTVDALGSKTIQREVIQKQLIDKINVYVDGGGYPIWTQEGIDWHMTIKDTNRWHITKSDRSMSYWFEVDAGAVTSVAPKRAEYGSHREKHKSLDEAPGEVPKFVKNNISKIIKVTDKEP